MARFLIEFSPERTVVGEPFQTRGDDQRFPSFKLIPSGELISVDIKRVIKELTLDDEAIQCPIHHTEWRWHQGVPYCPICEYSPEPSEPAIVDPAPVHGILRAAPD